LPLSVRSAFYPLIGDRIWGRAGDFIDLLAVVSTVFGLACTIGIGATQATGGLAYLFGVTPSLGLQIGLIAVMTLLAIFSVVRGVKGGVKLLSNINMTLAGGLLLFVLIAGPSLAIAKSIGSVALTHIPDSLKLANWLGREDQQFLQDWTWFYWAWWIAWSPFVGLFIARISKGRTVREFMTGVLFAPFVIGVVWFCAFGETAITQYETQSGDLATGISDASLTLFQMLDAMPFSQVTSVIALGLMIIFIVTSADSGALVVDNLTSGGRMQTAKRQRVLWAALLGLTAISLLYGGGTKALQALQAGTITVALPFSIVVLMFGVCLVKGLRDELKLEKAAAPDAV
jgi:BCCT family betaine/carnitine transporter